jgi:hypothetical protein
MMSQLTLSIRARGEAGVRLDPISLDVRCGQSNTCYYNGNRQGKKEKAMYA